MSMKCVVMTLISGGVSMRMRGMSSLMSSSSSWGGSSAASSSVTSSFPWPSGALGSPTVKRRRVLQLSGSTHSPEGSVTPARSVWRPLGTFTKRGRIAVEFAPSPSRMVQQAGGSSSMERQWEASL